jgi:hypothetical protein
MKSLLRIEEAALLVLAVYLNTFLPYSWWWYWVLFLAPDIGAIGYVVNPKIGAFTYNLVHLKAIAIAIYIAGIYISNHELQFTGLLLLGHSSFDRLVGYGLKYSDDFKHTHLGMIGKVAKSF